jgi:integrase
VPRKPRIPQPWQRKDRNNDWYVTLPAGNGKQRQVFLASADAPAEAVQDAFAKAMSQASLTTAREDAAIGALLNKYLLWVRDHQAKDTFDIRRDFVQSFLMHVGGDAAVKELRPFHVTGWLDAHRTWGDSTRTLAVRSILAGLNWARGEGYIDSHPLDRRLRTAGYRSRSRDVVMEEETYREWLSWCRHESARYLLIALWHSGCRPGEIFTLGEAHDTFFDDAKGVWVVHVDGGQGVSHFRGES